MTTFLLSALAGIGAWFLLRAVLGEVGKDVVFLAFSAGSLVGNLVRNRWWTAVFLVLATAYWSVVLQRDLGEREPRGQR